MTLNKRMNLGRLSDFLKKQIREGNFNNLFDFDGLGEKFDVDSIEVQQVVEHLVRTKIKEPVIQEKPKETPAVKKPKTRTFSIPRSLGGLCSHFNEEFDFDRIVKRFKSYPGFDPDKGFHISSYVHSFCQHFLNIVLEDVVESSSDFKISLDTPFVKGAKVGTYILKNDSCGRTFVSLNNEKRKNKTRYSKIIFLDGMPVVFDIKYGDWRLRGKNRSQGTSLKLLLMPKTYNPHLFILKKFFGSHVSYAILVSKDLSRKRSKHIHGFEAQGNAIAPLYYERAELSDVVREVVLDNGLKLKE